MDDLGFIMTSYVVTFASVACFALFVVRRARRYGRDVSPDERPWT